MSWSKFELTVAESAPPDSNNTPLDSHGLQICALELRKPNNSLQDHTFLGFLSPCQQHLQYAVNAIRSLHESGYPSSSSKLIVLDDSVEAVEAGPINDPDPQDPLLRRFRIDGGLIPSASPYA